MARHKHTKTKAAEIEHAIRHHLDVELDDDPDLKASFAEALAAIFEQFRDNWQKIHEELEKLRARIVNAREEPTCGLHRKKRNGSGASCAPTTRRWKGRGPGCGNMASFWRS